MQVVNQGSPPKILTPLAYPPHHNPASRCHLPGAFTNQASRHAPRAAAAAAHHHHHAAIASRARGNYDSVPLPPAPPPPRARCPSPHREAQHRKTRQLHCRTARSQQAPRLAPRAARAQRRLQMARRGSYCSHRHCPRARYAALRRARTPSRRARSSGALLGRAARSTSDRWCTARAPRPGPHVARLREERERRYRRAFVRDAQGGVGSRG